MRIKPTITAVLSFLALLTALSPTALADTCIAQDQTFSYEASAAGRTAAEVAALAVCRHESERPAACRVQRCARGEETRRIPPGGNRAPPPVEREVPVGAIRAIERGGKKCWGRKIPKNVSCNYSPYGRWPRSFENPYGRE